MESLGSRLVATRIKLQALGKVGVVTEGTTHSIITQVRYAQVLQIQLLSSHFHVKIVSLVILNLCDCRSLLSVAISSYPEFRCMNLSLCTYRGDDLFSV